MWLKFTFTSHMNKLRYRLKSKEETMCLVKIVKITIRERKTYNY